jgi:hypothetical protein
VRKEEKQEMCQENKGGRGNFAFDKSRDQDFVHLVQCIALVKFSIIIS